jgi:hypothetical protein
VTIQIDLTLITPALEVTRDTMNFPIGRTLQEIFDAVLKKHRDFRPPKVRLVLNRTPRRKEDFAMRVVENSTLALLGRTADEEEEGETFVLDA